mmetsp:Transcript_14900/g.32188  ORF Transcript_14900/g.32188 Transcript_14900/m.32188 type:complete len:226 (+) Transcript_14900:2725-3402(+)
MKVLQRSRKIINTKQPIRPNLPLLLPLHIHNLSNTLALRLLLLPVRNLERQRFIKTIKYHEESIVEDVSIRHGPHLDDTGMANHREELTLHRKINHSTHITFRILQALITQSLDSIPCKLPLTQASARHELTILNDHSIVAEFSKLILFFIHQAEITVVGVEGRVGLEFEGEDFVDYAEASSAEDTSEIELRLFEPGQRSLGFLIKDGRRLRLFSHHFLCSVEES